VEAFDRAEVQRAEAQRQIVVPVDIAAMANVLAEIAAGVVLPELPVLRILELVASR